MFRKDDIPQSWSALTWQQLCNVWECKVRYGGNPDVARAAALLKILQTLPIEGGEWAVEQGDIDPVTGEQQYMLSTPSLTGRAVGGSAGWVLSPRSLSQLAQQLLPWFDYPYGDPGKEAVKDEKGMVIEEAVNPHRGYVSEMRDAMILPEQELEVDGVLFALPQMACNNLTWQQYRSLQALVPMLFQEGTSEEDVLDVQAQFLAQMLVPARDNTNNADRFAPKHDFTYNTERAEQTVGFWRKHLQPHPQPHPRPLPLVEGGGYLRRIFGVKHSRQEYIPPSTGGGVGGGALFHICFQCYQTALTYYAQAYPLLFNDDGNKDTMRDALQGEVGTINAVMMKAHYTSQQEVYDSNLPFVLDILNTMTKEAKEIEKMNARIKSRQ